MKTIGERNHKHAQQRTAKQKRTSTKTSQEDDPSIEPRSRLSYEREKELPTYLEAEEA
jgi:hypothetical protein